MASLKSKLDLEALIPLWKTAFNWQLLIQIGNSQIQVAIIAMYDALKVTSPKKVFLP